MSFIQVHTTALTLVGFFFGVLAAMPAFGHDPLRDSHTQHRQEQRIGGNRQANLPELREKIIAFRTSGDDRHLDDAWALLAPGLEDTNISAESLVLAAFVQQSRHQFVEAISLVERSLAINNRNDEAWLLLASIHLVLGESEAAADACGQLRASPPIVLLTCKARVALATGDHEFARLRLERILAQVNQIRLPAETLAWSYSVAGDLAVAAGASRDAVSLYEKSLALAERTQVRSALVDVFLSRQDHHAAARTLEQGSPALPLLVRRLIVAKQLGQLDELQPTLTEVQEEFETWIANEDWLHAREMARFYIDVVSDPVRARQLALVNLTVQQEPEDHRLLQIVTSNSHGSSL